MKKHRYDPNKKAVKYYLLQRYHCHCMCCGQVIKSNLLQLHHIIKWEHTHITTIEDSSIVCEKCHKQINYAELHDKKQYEQLNNTIRQYKQRAS